MKNKTNKKTVLLIGIGFAVLFWIMETSIEVLIFNHGSFVGQILTVDSHEIWSRLTAMGIIILFGVYAQSVITKRKRIEEALRASERWLSTTLRSIGDAVIATDAKGHVTLMNHVAQSLTGWNEEEAMEQPLEDVFNIINEQTGKQAENPVTKVIQEGLIVGLANHTVLIAKDGMRRPVDDSGAPIKDDMGNTTGVILVFRDITERKQAEEELQKRTHDLGERVKELNCLYGISSVAEKQGVPLGEILQEIVSLIPPSWKYPEVTCARIIINSQEFVTVNFRETVWKQTCDITIRGNSVGGVEVYYLEERPECDEGPFLKEERNLINAIAERVGRITEQKQAEEELQASEKWLSITLRSIGDAVISTDAKGHVTLMNPVAQTLTGWNEEDAKEKPLKDVFNIINEETGKQVENPATKVIQEGLIVGLANHTVLIAKDGTKWPIDDSGAPIRDDKGNITGVVLVFRDITERKQTEEQIKASLAEKELLLKEIHHRVKNNMQVISSLLKLQSERTEDKRVRELFSDSQKRIQSMALIYNKLYQSSDLSRIDLRDYINELTKGLIQSYRGASSKIAAKIDGENVLLAVDLAIPCGLFINELISNSLKYAFPNNKNAEIRVSVREISKNEIEIIVSDNGVGIPSNVDLANTKTLGLYLVTTLVENQLGGRLELERSKGTQFRITFNKNQ